MAILYNAIFLFFEFIVSSHIRVYNYKTWTTTTEKTKDLYSERWGDL
jgi:hypothetical protein